MADEDDETAEFVESMMRQTMTSPDKIALADELLTWFDMEINVAKHQQIAGFNLGTAQGTLAGEKAHSRQCALYEAKQVVASALRCPVLPHREALEEVLEPFAKVNYDPAFWEADDPVTIDCSKVRFEEAGLKVGHFWKAKAALQSMADTVGREPVAQARSKLSRGPWRIEPHQHNPYNCHVVDANGQNVITNCGKAFAEWIVAVENNASPSPSPAQPGAEREEVAAFLLGRDENDITAPVSDYLIQWGQTIIAHGKDAVHSGDCTKESHSCARCLADRTLQHADQLLALISPASGGGK